MRFIPTKDYLIMYYTLPSKKQQLPRYIVIIPLIMVIFILWFLFKPNTPIVQTSTQHIKQPEQLEPLTQSGTVVLDKDKDNEQNIHLTLISKSNDNLSKLFESALIPSSTLINLLMQINHADKLKNIKPNQRFHFITNKDKELIQLTYRYSPLKQLLITKKKHVYVSKIMTLIPKKERHFITGTIEGSLYTTGQKQKIPHSLLFQLTRIFARSINFSKDIRNNDRFTLVYQTNTFKNQPSTIGKILAARYTSKKQTYTAINYESFDQNHNYFTPEGRSLKLNFDRYPIQFTHISSQFNPYRMHPILKINRPHRGIDLAAKQGSPIHAVADGIIAQIGLNSGYGNAIKIAHSKKYKTVYGHMLRFTTGLTKGARVKRGDIIGYVGQTGLATAPHCHFEFRVFGKQVDPATIELPTAPSINKKTLLAFKKKTKRLLEQLSLYESASTASDS